MLFLTHFYSHFSVAAFVASQFSKCPPPFLRAYTARERSTVFLNSIERWVTGLKTSEMKQGEDFGYVNGNGETLRRVRGDREHIEVS